jgi:hypothetical protein
MKLGLGLSALALAQLAGCSVLPGSKDADEQDGMAMMGQMRGGMMGGGMGMGDGKAPMPMDPAAMKRRMDMMEMMMQMMMDRDSVKPPTAK